MPFLQDSIHKLEEGGGLRFVRFGLGVLVVLALAVGYDWRAYRNMSSQEAMDAAQVGRNLSQGKGFSTLYIRPFSMFLLKRHAQATGDTRPDPARIKGMHPDLANPPVYPLVLAGLMKTLPFEYVLPAKPKPFWNFGSKFWRYEPDFLITVFNQLVFVAATVLVFFLARRLFDPAVAVLSAVLMLTTEIFWRFSSSGLSTMLLLFFFVALIWVLALIEDEARAPRFGLMAQLTLAVLAGLLVGLGALTRYAYGWLIIPVLVFLFLFGGQRRVGLGLVTLVVFAALLFPWMARNYSLSGTPFGTAGYSILETSGLFPENRLLRSLEPDLSRLYLTPFWVKFMVNSRQILVQELPRLGGSWVTAFFLAGLLVPFRRPAITRLRYFLVASLFVLTVAQAFGRTQLSEDSPEINSENLLVLLLPMVLIYGVSFFFLLLDQLTFPLPLVRLLVIVLFGVLTSLPMVFAFLPPRTVPVSYPPYYPPAIQTVAGWMKEKELAMSDIPWGVAWYGERQCVWLTLNAQKDFLAIHDYQKPISILYLTPATMDSRFLSQWVRAAEQSWGSFILESLVRKEVPPLFPLRKSPGGWLPEQLVLTDWERWSRPPQDDRK
ncbi:MAG TPA: glycosyltransferase family 39 protein [Methylomirabilota bacterium]|nr:glycosyltransferase family 39 protein [Methylomirabilota bacterium]